MKVENKPDFEISDSSCMAATGKSLAEWYAELDSVDGLKIGRRNCTQRIADSTKDAWWMTTIAVEYERHKQSFKKDGLPEGYSICVTKTISAPIEKAYTVWTNPQSFSEMFGDGGKQAVAEGGEISCSGGCKGVFTRIRENKDLRFSWSHPGCSAPMTVDVMFQDNKGKTLMNVMTSRIQTRAEADGLRNAWSEALSRLKSLCEK